ncbi:MAG: hypothetical protein HY048_02935 [Acidobacteria bacterium]|nr:hypothetical protein [Acidobacteriota bacterium]
MIRLLVEKDHELRYMLSGGAVTGQLLVQVQFAERIAARSFAACTTWPNSR